MATGPTQSNPARVAAGLLFLGMASAAALLMAVKHILGVQLPGCGVGSACDAVARGAYGGIPVGGGVRVPTSFIGFAYFDAMLVGWAISGGLLPAALRWVARLGMLVSVVLTIVLFKEGHLCPYCLVVHGANLVFWIIAETAGRPVDSPFARRAVVMWAIALIALLSASLAIAFAVHSSVTKRDEEELAKSTQAAVEQSKNRLPSSATPPGAPFTGRYRYGPEAAPIRLVIISDYQCIDCQMVEKQVRALLQSRTDISLSAKHFPMCSDCNRYMQGQNMHPNACWAARAAETAGILRGNEGFWQMHFWLFDHGGGFTDQELNQALVQMGYDAAEFTRLMQSDTTLSLVQADVEEGRALGLYFTPMVFINGVELRGWRAPNAVTRAVEAVAATNPPALTAAHDRPPLAAEKFIEDWRQMNAIQMPPDARPWALGPDTAAVKLHMWGDYTEPMTKKWDARIARFMREHPDVTVQYVFHHYPFDQSCNSTISRTMMPQGCLASRAAEAAGMINGVDGYWAMHRWLFEHQTNLTEQVILQAAPSLGLVAGALQTAMGSSDVVTSIQQETIVGKKIIPQGIPTLYVNGKWLTRWELPNDDVFDEVLLEAAGVATTH